MIIYCNIGIMDYYNGIENDSISGGGSYNDNNIGHEVNNFTSHNGKYFGFVQAKNDTIDIQRNFNAPQNSDSVNDILVVWTNKKKYIIGYYKNATVYKKTQQLEEKYLNEREYLDYNITSDHAVLFPKEKRTFTIEYPNVARNVWYGDDITNKKVEDFIKSFDNDLNNTISTINSNTIDGKEKEALIKIRVNQGEFRKRILNKFNCKCCLCGVSMESLLIASHIKPWSKSESNEKLSSENGFLLCPNHDKLFDSGLISFDEKGKILISDSLDDSNQIFTNIRKDMNLDKEKYTSEMQKFMKYHRDIIFIK